MCLFDYKLKPLKSVNSKIFLVSYRPRKNILLLDFRGLRMGILWISETRNRSDVHFQLMSSIEIKEKIRMKDIGYMIMKIEYKHACTRSRYIDLMNQGDIKRYFHVDTVQCKEVKRKVCYSMERWIVREGENWGNWVMEAAALGRSWYHIIRGLD